MSVCRKLPDGTIQKIAGHTILLDANVSEIRTGTWSLAGSSGGISTNITFTDPMPDTDYIVVVEPSADRNWGNPGPDPIGISDKTTTGFRLSSHTFSTVTTFTGKYWAYKLVPIEGYTALQNKINNPDNTPTIDSMNLVTSDGVARAIENASAVWKGTKAEWNALPATTKIKYDLAVLIDTQLIKSVDRTDGTDSDVADLTSVWTGTQAEWDAMTQAQKDKWDKALIKDDEYFTDHVTLVKDTYQVPVADWVADTTYSAYPFKADIPIQSVTADFSPDVRMRLADVITCNYAPVAEAFDGYVRIYAKVKPSAVITIPTIVCTLIRI